MPASKRSPNSGCDSPVAADEVAVSVEGVGVVDAQDGGGPGGDGEVEAEHAARERFADRVCRVDETSGLAK